MSPLWWAIPLAVSWFVGGLALSIRADRRDWGWSLAAYNTVAFVCIFGSSFLLTWAWVTSTEP